MPLILLLLTLVSSGFALQLLSFLLPAIVRDWQLQGTALTSAFSLHLLGITLGAFALGRLGDRLGRRQVLLLSLGLQAITALACIWVRTPFEMSALRFLAGVAIGGMMPNAVALATELAPPAQRTRWTTLVLSGVALGSALPALAIRALLPDHGWESLFILASASTFLLWVAVALKLPESPQFLQLTRDPNAAHRLADLFRGPMARVTLCLWTMYAGAMLAMHLLTSWLPLLLENAGLGATRAADLTGIVHLAGVVATLCSVIFLSLWRQWWLHALILISLVSVGVIALWGFDNGALALCIAGLGFGLIGIQGVLGAVAGQVYPVHIRPTGVGAAMAVGRLGSMLGPLIGGAVQTAGTTAQGLFTLPLWSLAATLLAACLFDWRQFRSKPG